MIKLKVVTEIDRPVAEVFAYVTDVRNYVKWQSEVVSSDFVSTGPTQVGSTFKFSAEFMGRRVDTVGEVTAHEPPRLFSWKSTASPFPITGSTTFEPTDTGTRITDTAEVDAGGFFKLAGPLLAKQMQNLMEKDSRKLKELMEAQPVRA